MPDSLDLAAIEAEAHRLATLSDGAEDRTLYLVTLRRLVNAAVDEQIRAEQG